MIEFHITLIDECQEHFSVSMDASDHQEAFGKAREAYPECQVFCVQTLMDIQEEESTRFERLSQEWD